MKRLVGGLVAAVFTLGAVCGCVSWASYPAQPGEGAIKNPNDPAIVDVIVASMEWVVRKYPPGPEDAPAPRLAVNIPPGVQPRIYESVARRVGHGAVPLSHASESLPIFHVAQLRIRGDEAAVDILRPATELGMGPDGKPVYQEIRVNLRGGVRPWEVTSHREWTPGTVSRMPEMNYLDQAPPAAPAAPAAGTVDPQR